MKYFESNALKIGIEKMPIFGDMIEKMKEEVNNFVDNFNDHPSLLSQWGHHDFCSDDGGKLIFDLNHPYDHICEICGKNNKSELLDGVWVYNYRNEAVNTIWKSAFLYQKTKEEKYLNHLYKVLGFYSDNYLSFKLHNKEQELFDSYETMKWGCGRMMPQGLNEAIITIRIINALELVKEDIDQEFLAKMKTDFFDEVTKLLIPQVDKIHNISCWKNSAIGAIGLFYNDNKLIDFVFKGKYNINKQVEKGVTKDGFWFEGSIHYNFFTLEGIINLILFAKLYDYKLEDKLLNTITHMLKSAYLYAFDNVVLPNPNDGWPNINLKTYSYIYAVGTKIFGIDSEIGNLLKLIETSKTKRVELPLSKPYYYNNEISLERLILVPDLDLSNIKEVERGSINFESSQYAILKNKNVNVFMKYGHNGPSHAHPDKMNIEVMLFNNLLTRDLSNAGYGNKYCNEWHRVTPSHNTVVINGRNQRSMAKGKTVSFTNNKMVFKVDNVYGLDAIKLDELRGTMNHDEVNKYLKTRYKFNDSEIKRILSSGEFNEKLDLTEPQFKGINYKRTIEINEFGYIDDFFVSSRENTTMDLFMHVDGKLLTEVNEKPESLGFTTDGYQHIQNVRKIANNCKNFTLKWQVGNLIVTSKIDLVRSTLYLAETYDNPITNLRNTLIIRYHGKRRKFNQKWEVEEIL